MQACLVYGALLSLMKVIENAGNAELSRVFSLGRKEGGDGVPPVSRQSVRIPAPPSLPAVLNSLKYYVNFSQFSFLPRIVPSFSSHFANSEISDVVRKAGAAVVL